MVKSFKLLFFIFIYLKGRGTIVEKRALPLAFPMLRKAVVGPVQSQEIGTQSRSRNPALAPSLLPPGEGVGRKLGFRPSTPT